MIGGHVESVPLGIDPKAHREMAGNPPFFNRVVSLLFSRLLDLAGFPAFLSTPFNS
jgi:hypothetical protein